MWVTRICDFPGNSFSFSTYNCPVTICIIGVLERCSTLTSWGFLERVRKPENNTYIEKRTILDKSLSSLSNANFFQVFTEYASWLKSNCVVVHICPYIDTTTNWKTIVSWRKLTLKISAIFRCWGSEQWFSMDMIIGRSEVMKALRSMASTTSCKSQTAP